MRPLRTQLFVLGTLLSLCFLAPHCAHAQELKPLPTGDVDPDQERWLEKLATAADYYSPAMRLQKSANSGVFAKLNELASDKSKKKRARAGFALSLIPTKETLNRCLELALNDKDAGVRTQVAGSLLANDNPVLLKKAELLDELKKGLEDRKQDVQLTFALILGRNQDASGIDVLKRGLHHSYHHWQETSAEALAELGDDAGALVLIKMLKYTDKNHPFLKANADLRKDEEAWRDLLNTVNEERVRVCGHLGRLRCEKGLPVLEKLTTAKDANVAKAATHAIALIKNPAGKPTSDPRP